MFHCAMDGRMLLLAVGLLLAGITCRHCRGRGAGGSAASTECDFQRAGNPECIAHPRGRRTDPATRVTMWAAARLFAASRAWPMKAPGAGIPPACLVSVASTSVGGTAHDIKAAQGNINRMAREWASISGGHRLQVTGYRTRKRKA